MGTRRCGPTASHPVVLTQERRLGERMPAYHPYHGWVKLYVRSPQQKLSEPADFTIDCGPPLLTPAKTR